MRYIVDKSIAVDTITVETVKVEPTPVLGPPGLVVVELVENGTVEEVEPVSITISHVPAVPVMTGEA